MSEKPVSIYQSGQQVTVEGWYEVVGTGTLNADGTSQKIVCKMTEGMIFPNSNGRAVCWLLLEKSPATHKDPPQADSPHFSDWH